MEQASIVGAALPFQPYQHRLNQISQKVKLLSEEIFPKNQKTPFCIEKKYIIYSWEFATETSLVELFLKCMGLDDVPQESIKKIASTSCLQKNIKEAVLPELDRLFGTQDEGTYVPMQEDIDSFLRILQKLNECLKILPENNQQALSFYFNIRTLRDQILNSPFSVIKEDLEQNLFLAQIDLLKGLHICPESEEFEIEFVMWNEKLLKRYNSSIPIETSFPYERKNGDIPIIQVKMNGIVVSFHALPISIVYLFKFSSLTQQQKAPPISDTIGFLLPPDKTCNCMSFAVGRKSLKPITPNKIGTTPNRISQFHKQLIESGCINVESIQIEDIQKLTEIPGKHKFTYLTAFVFDSGGSETGTADFHVYRCFFDREKGPIWMELAQAKGGIQFSKIRDTNLPILGIPANPQKVFCKDQWNIFAGYWLVPPEASFGVTLKNPNALITKKADFVRFN